MPRNPSSKVRCFVIAATYKEFDSFCRKMKVNPKATDVICVIPDSGWTKHLTGLSPDHSVFVFLRNWDYHCKSEVKCHLLDRVNLITSRSSEPYERERGT